VGHRAIDGLDLPGVADSRRVATLASDVAMSPVQLERHVTTVVEELGETERLREVTAATVAGIRTVRELVAVWRAVAIAAQRVPPLEEQDPRLPFEVEERDLGRRPAQVVVALGAGHGPVCPLERIGE
jgi:hypothetical protein